jgi:sec-independent protein translocase protein TatC
MKAILSKLFGVRNKLAAQRGQTDTEMPFLEHLEELRGVLVRIIITLLLATILCFAFRGPLLLLIKRPMETAGLGVEIKVPDALSKAEWRKAESLAKTARNLNEAERAAFLEHALTEPEAKLLPFVAAMPIFNATLLIEFEKRDQFVLEAVPNNTTVREAVQSLVKLNPKAKIDRQGNLMTMSALRPPEMFMLTIKLALMAGFIISFPLLLFFLAQFIFPGLTKKEKRAILPAIGIGFGLFLVGVVFAYTMVTPRVLDFFHGYSDDLGVASDWRIGYYITFVSQLILVFGLSFELPVIVMTLVKLDLLGYEFMSKNRSYAIVIIFTIAAIITPTPDAGTLCLLAGPMVFLYEMCIWMSWFVDRKRKRQEAAEEVERALYRKKRQADTKPPIGLPTGTVAAAASNDDDQDDKPDISFEDNDALKGDDEPVYEEGFAPRLDSDDSSYDDPYSHEDHHNSFYDHGDDLDSNAETEDSERVDDEPRQDNKGNGPSKLDDSDDQKPPTQDD